MAKHEESNGFGVAVFERHVGVAACRIEDAVAGGVNPSGDDLQEILGVLSILTSDYAEVKRILLLQLVDAFLVPRTDISPWKPDKHLVGDDGYLLSGHVVSMDTSLGPVTGHPYRPAGGLG